MMKFEADVCVAGGGPAGLVLSLLLARDGHRVTVLEKHADFLRDFRGDTIHPSTLTLLDQLGLGDKIEKLPHRNAAHMRVTFADGTYPLADFSRLRVPHPYLMFVPQWDFLELLASDKLGLKPRDFGAPMDVLWFRLPRRDSDAQGANMHVGAGRLLILIDRGDYFQVAYVIPKGGYDDVNDAGLPAFRESIARLAPALADRVDALAGWDDVRMLTVRLDRLARWHVPGALLIGDAAHAMSPAGGVGINLAIQDAVAAARILGTALHAGRPADLGAVRRRRLFATAGTQFVQRGIQRILLTPALGAHGPVQAPLPIRLLNRVPAAQRIPAQIIGVGLRPEYVI